MPKPGSTRPQQRTQLIEAPLLGILTANRLLGECVAESSSA